MAMNQDVVINKLLAMNVIARTGRRGWYAVRGQVSRMNRAGILRLLTTEVTPARYEFRYDQIRRLMGTVEPEVREELRTLERHAYHSVARNIDEALARIPVDEDGVRRSFGIEYEVFTLNARQEDALAKLLDTLPSHVVERDASLGLNGCEIIFDPVSAEEYVRVVKTLQEFVNTNGVKMGDNEVRMAGMHTTYGVSNAEASKQDLQIRLNRFALAVKAVATRQSIKDMFGRDFGHYRTLPQDTMTVEHGNAFSTAGRPETCWECRLPSWNCKPEKLVEFFKATEVAFHRPVEAVDFLKVFEIMGATTEGGAN